MISIRGGSGLGDALYVQAVARHLVKAGAQLEVRTDFQDVFRPLKDSVKVVPFSRERVDRLAHYSARRGIAGSDQFEDCCIQAGIKGPVEFALDWKPLNTALIERLRKADKPIIVVQMPRTVFGRGDGFGMECLPNCAIIQRAIDLLAGRAFIVQIGAGTSLYRFTGIELDLSNKTSVSDVIDIGYAADGFLGYCSFIIPLAESFAKPVHLIWSRKGLQSPNYLLRQITPEKVLHRTTSTHSIDDCKTQELVEAVDALYYKARVPVSV